MVGLLSRLYPRDEMANHGVKAGLASDAAASALRSFEGERQKATLDVVVAGAEDALVTGRLSLNRRSASRSGRLEIG